LRQRLRSLQLRFASLPAASAPCSGMGSMVQEPSKQAIGSRIASGHGSQASSLRSVQMSGNRQVQWLVRTAQRRWIAILKATVSALSTPEPAPAKLRAYRCWSQASRQAVWRESGVPPSLLHARTSSQHGTLENKRPVKMILAIMRKRFLY